jgi:hypothetical protein
MKPVKSTLLSKDGEMVLYALNVDIVKRGIFQRENFLTAKAVDFKRVGSRDYFSRDEDPFGKMVLAALSYGDGQGRSFHCGDAKDSRNWAIQDGLVDGP